MEKAGVTTVIQYRVNTETGRRLPEHTVANLRTEGVEPSNGIGVDQGVVENGTKQSSFNSNATTIQQTIAKLPILWTEIEYRPASQVESKEFFLQERRKRTLVGALGVEQALYELEPVIMKPVAASR